jgi:transcription antitermination factor NusG
MSLSKCGIVTTSRTRSKASKAPTEPMGQTVMPGDTKASERPWYVLHVMSNHEKRVAQHLGLRMVEHYLPLCVQRSRWTDRVVTLERPLFAGYVFARFTLQSRLAVLTIPGVLRLLGDEHHNTVEAVEINRIRDGLEMGYALRPHPGLSVGTHVRVIHGLFEGTEGIVTELHQRCKVVMSLSATNRCFSLEMDAADIEVLHRPAA